MSKKQFGKRLLQILIVLIGVSFFTFGLTYLSPGDPAEIMLTECGNLPTPELLEQTRHELGLDQPFLVQYGSWVKGVLTGDMGTSYAFKVPVTEKLMKCFWPTLQMSLFALLLMILFSIPCGILSAVYQNKWPDYLIRGITFFGVSIPSFWIGLILLSIFGVQLRWINVAGGTTDFKAMNHGGRRIQVRWCCRLRHWRFPCLQNIPDRYETQCWKNSDRIMSLEPE